MGGVAEPAKRCGVKTPTGNCSESSHRVSCSAMFAASDLSNSTKAELYRELAAQCRALIDGETDSIANMANCAALIFHSVPRLNWAGFYLLKGGELILGPFQGRPACVGSHSGAASVERRRKITQRFESRT